MSRTVLGRWHTLYSVSCCGDVWPKWTTKGSLAEQNWAQYSAHTSDWQRGGGRWALRDPRTPQGARASTSKPASRWHWHPEFHQQLPLSPTEVQSQEPFSPLSGLTQVVSAWGRELPGTEAQVVWHGAWRCGFQWKLKKGGKAAKKKKKKMHFHSA